MKWYTYILLCDQKMYYIGITSNLKERMKQHKFKKSKFTKQFSDLKLVYYEKFLTKDNAEKRENQLKGWSNAKKTALINNDKGLLVTLSRST